MQQGLRGGIRLWRSTGPLALRGVGLEDLVLVVLDMSNLDYLQVSLSIDLICRLPLRGIILPDLPIDQRTTRGFLPVTNSEDRLGGGDNHALSSKEVRPDRVSEIPMLGVTLLRVLITVPFVHNEVPQEVLILNEGDSLIHLKGLDTTVPPKPKAPSLEVVGDSDIPRGGRLRSFSTTWARAPRRIARLTVL